MSEKERRYNPGDKVRFDLRLSKKGRDEDDSVDQFSSEEVRSIYSSNFGEDEIEEEYIEDIDKYIEEKQGLQEGTMDFVQKFFMSLKNPDAAKYVSEKIANPQKSDEQIGKDYNIPPSSIRKFAANERISSFLSDVYARKSSHIVNRNIATISKVSEMLSMEMNTRFDQLKNNRIDATQLLNTMDAQSAKVVLSQRIEGMDTKDLVKTMLSGIDMQNRAAEKIIDRTNNNHVADQAIEKISRKYFESINAPESNVKFDFDSVSITLSNGGNSAIKEAEETTIIEGEEE